MREKGGAGLATRGWIDGLKRNFGNKLQEINTLSSLSLKNFIEHQLYGMT